jgi:phage shock protein E
MPTTRQPTPRSATPLVIGMVALAALVVAYFAMGMPGMDHSAGTHPSMNHSRHRLVGPTEFSALLDDPDVTSIDVDRPSTAAPLPGTDLSMPFDAIDVDQLPTDRTRTLAIYCRSGAMSARAADQLVDLGYTNIVELEGGTDSWATATPGRASDS